MPVGERSQYSSGTSDWRRCVRLACSRRLRRLKSEHESRWRARRQFVLDGAAVYWGILCQPLELEKNVGSGLQFHAGTTRNSRVELPSSTVRFHDNRIKAPSSRTSMLWPTNGRRQEAKPRQRPNARNLFESGAVAERIALRISFVDARLSQRSSTRRSARKCPGR